MSETPAYYAWYPVLDKKKSAASIILTRGERERPPVGGRNFFDAVLDAAGIQAELAAWGVQSFLSSYFSEKDWEESWDARLLLSEPATLKSESTINGVGVFVDPDSEEEPARSLPVRVLADFARRREADDCRTELKEQAAKAKWNEIHYERYAIRDIGAKHKQLVVDVATRERDRLAEAIDAAERVIATCERHGGRTCPSK
ncbi:MAG: hypothetical protein LC808_30520 [Actinobacteria bacterium]|nr:hypothetical protein [Actinomycetota bacterium]